VNRTAVESTTLVTVAYDEASGALQLEFRRGSIYQYFDVSAAVYEGLLMAPSRGNYFNQFIRGRFRYRLILNTGAGGCSEAFRSEGAR
jgi:KTSC domain